MSVQETMSPNVALEFNSVFRALLGMKSMFSHFYTYPFRTARACLSHESPLPPRGQSSLSECDELEYDYYDGTTFPGSFLAPVQDVMYSQIDIDQVSHIIEMFYKLF